MTYLYLNLIYYLMQYPPRLAEIQLYTRLKKKPVHHLKDINIHSFISSA